MAGIADILACKWGRLELSTRARRFVRLELSTRARRFVRLELSMCARRVHCVQWNIIYFQIFTLSMKNILFCFYFRQNAGLHLHQQLHQHLLIVHSLYIANLVLELAPAVQVCQNGL